VVRKSAGKLIELKKQFKDDITIWLVNSELEADRASIRKEAEELGLADLPVLLDTKQALAQSFGVQRTAETIVLDTKSWSIVYRGALDDQLTEGAEKPGANGRYAELALAALLKGEAVPHSQTAVKGCLLTYGKNNQTNEPWTMHEKSRRFSRLIALRAIGQGTSGRSRSPATRWPNARRG
jgi:hypothetical protein